MEYPLPRAGRRAVDVLASDRLNAGAEIAGYDERGRHGGVLRVRNNVTRERVAPHRVRHNEVVDDLECVAVRVEPGGSAVALDPLVEDVERACSASAGGTAVHGPVRLVGE